MGDKVTAIAVLVVSALLFLVSIRSFLEKGFLLHNAYLYATPKQRETMNKKPYYRQTAVLFFLMGMVFLCIGLAILFRAGWITCVAEAVILIIVIYAIVSTVAIEKRKTKER